VAGRCCKKICWKSHRGDWPS